VAIAREWFGGRGFNGRHATARFDHLLEANDLGVEVAELREQERFVLLRCCHRFFIARLETDPACAASVLAAIF
jgi:hypothetical protein